MPTIALFEKSPHIYGGPCYSTAKNCNCVPFQPGHFISYLLRQMSDHNLEDGILKVSKNAQTDLLYIIFKSYFSMSKFTFKNWQKFPNFKY